MNISHNQTASSELVFNLIGADGDTTPLPVTLSYDPSNPYEIHAIFRTGNGDGVEWLFARELLSYGITIPYGDGDVRVWPSNDMPERTYVGLDSPDGKAVMEASKKELGDFLERTYGLVPEGAESLHLDVDAAISQLLDR